MNKYDRFCSAIICILCCAVLVLTGCGRRSEIIDEVYNHTDLSLTVSAPRQGAWRLRAAADSLIRETAREGINLEVNIISYDPGEAAEHSVLLLSQFAAGVGPDLIVLGEIPLHPFIYENFLLDINTLINENAYRGHFFSNVLEAYEVNVQLFVFPMDFELNRNITPELKFMAQLGNFLNLNNPIESELTGMYGVLEQLAAAENGIAHMPVSQLPSLAVAVSANANGSLVWDYIWHLIRLVATDDTAGGYTSIAREFANEVYENPVLTPIAGFIIPQELILPAFSQFIAGNTTAQAALQAMEQSVAVWLAADIYIPEFELPWELPVRTLLIHAPENYVGVFNEAAAVFNASNSEFELRLRFETYELFRTDWERPGERLANFQTQLMAGLGPDIFLLDGHPVNSMAELGLLACFYSLIDQDPHASREDFFAQALTAFETGGSLHMFPASFGFYYAAINSALPQRFIDRFIQYESVTITQLMEMYLDFVESNGDEIENLRFNTMGPLGQPTGALRKMLTDFVNFETHQANLTDERFVSLLNTLNSVYNNRPPITIRTNQAAHDFDWPQVYSGYQVFLVERGDRHAAQGLFTPQSPYFTNYIPLVDDAGRLLLNTRIDTHWLSSWAIFCVIANENQQLAWELIRHTIPVFVNPQTTEARNHNGQPNMWGAQSLSTPIARQYFQDHALNSLRHHFGTTRLHNMPAFVGMDTHEEREARFQEAVERLAAYNQRRMTLDDPMIPERLYNDALTYFMQGLIPAEEAAQRMQNSISLWLIE